ncbi:tRNA dimethylallyltransferase [Caldalkalibacillus thermarum]|uniref:tRNA (adenosine(37)-N6)-dimethylallyltransferase MiaA n=1 Tax=Caldalkalibacillus thermarum TaxID=296745 RepID=UPI0016666410|nr:tRNA (adenosine(37)-N6)-dimethylallyltransferase MiaA [Caldalkalibacillus thermarum]GGK13025.1 tRNA dimethylallyltransferase [Caldalkalibacillus thermarum]
MNKDRLLSIVGPTAVGKTKLSIELAKAFDGEIISGDSMQVYKGMDIGTAKIKEEEKEGIPHYLIDILEPHEDFSVSHFQNLTKSYIKEINRRGRLPILVGGTGLYVQAVTHDFHFAEKNNPALREKWKRFLAEHGKEALYKELQTRDPAYAARLHPNNTRRVIRALEILETTGKSMAHYQQDWHRRSPYDLVMIGLTMEREKLYQRINQRVDQMMEQGLVEEVKQLLARGVPKSSTSMQAIGYKEIVRYLEGELTLDEAVELIKRNTRRYAKRQLSWFRRMDEIRWFEVTDHRQFSAVVKNIIHYVAGKWQMI